MEEANKRIRGRSNGGFGQEEEVRLDRFRARFRAADGGGLGSCVNLGWRNMAGVESGAGGGAAARPRWSGAAAPLAEARPGWDEARHGRQGRQGSPSCSGPALRAAGHCPHAASRWPRPGASSRRGRQEDGGAGRRGVASQHGRSRGGLMRGERRAGARRRAAAEQGWPDEGRAVVRGGEQRRRGESGSAGWSRGRRWLGAEDGGEDNNRRPGGRG
uniref:Uncharacterized protein n=1 Tax=Setaria viridis TaxID=4556 RepID=A0A4U6UJT9_SETVI|nr:hypothetical protein SEVIR_6G194100v2 [Setaria viridis]